MARRRRSISDEERRIRLFAGRTPHEGLTKAQHDQLVAERGRPITQDPIGTTPHTVQTEKGK